MPRVKANGLEIEYEETGSPDAPMILLVSGYMGQMTEWPDHFKQALADSGRRVVVFAQRCCSRKQTLRASPQHTPSKELHMHRDSTWWTSTHRRSRVTRRCQSSR